MTKEATDGRAETPVRAPSGPGSREPRGDHEVGDSCRARRRSLSRSPRPQDLSFAGYGLSVVGLTPPWLPASGSAREGPVDWLAERGSVAEAPAGWAKEGPDDLTVGWARYAEYRLSIAPSACVHAVLDTVSDEESVLCFILSVIPLALPLFGLEPLHGSAVVCDDEAALLLGAAGAGKSSLAAALGNRGYGCLADDACAIDASGLLWPGPPLVAPRGDGAGGHVVGMYTGKMVTLVANHRSEPLRASRVLVLRPEPGASLAIRPLVGREAFTALLGHVRAPGVLRTRRRDLQLQVVARLAGLPVATLSYEPGRNSPEETADATANWISGEGP